MNILFDLNHPAHVHFFRHPISLLRDRGHKIAVTSRSKEMAVPLLNEMGIEHIMLSVQKGKGAFSLARELILRDIALFRIARHFKPDVMAAIGGTFISHIGQLTGIPSVVFYDTENAHLQNAITFPFSYRIFVPRCYSGWLPKQHIRYNGYHELSYLHPNIFLPNAVIAQDSGYDPEQPNFFIRTVSWQANHDLFESGWSIDLLRKLAEWLSKRGKVHISSESPLPDDLSIHAYRGRVSDVHHLMAYCRLFVGESATMASESAVLGVPAIYAANTGRGYTDEQETRYGLVKNLRRLELSTLLGTIENILAESKYYYTTRREQLLSETIDVGQYVTEQIELACRQKH